MLADGRFQPVLGDIAKFGDWLKDADVVTARTMLHHIPMVEFVLGRLRAALRPGTRVGFLEPDFRSALGRLAYLEATSRPELAPLCAWAVAINRLYLMNQISPAVGATLARTMELAGYRNVRGEWRECPSDASTIENMLMFFDEVRDRLHTLGIMSSAEIDRLQRLLRELPADDLPGAWGIFRVVCEV